MNLVALLPEKITSNEPSRVVAREDNFNEPSRFVAREDNLNKPSRVIPDIELGQRRRKRKRFSASWLSGTVKKVSKYCICHKRWTHIDKGFMVQCTSCLIWYHLSCLNLPSVNSSVSDEDIIFTCGQINCSSALTFSIKSGDSDNELIVKAFDAVKDIIINDSEDDKIKQTSYPNLLDFKEDIASERKPVTEVAANNSSLIEEHCNNIIDVGDSDNELIAKAFDAVKDIIINDSDDDKIKQTSYPNLLDSKEDIASERKPVTDVAANNSSLIEEHCNNIIDVGVLESNNYIRCTDPDPNSVSDLDQHTNEYRNNASNNDVAYLDLPEIEDILQVKIPNSKFEFTLQPLASFTISHAEWNTLRNTQRKRCFKRGFWQPIFLKGVSTINPYCCFIFLYHKVSEISRSHVTFSAKAKCKFNTCPVILELSMTELLTVNVTFSGNVCHSISEAHCRPIAGTERVRLRSDFSKGVKPLKRYLDIFNEADINKLVSGNFDGLGVGKNVFGQIASESRQHRADTICIDSLQEIMYQMKSDNDYGFIQKISANPFYILYWSLEGLKLFHKLAKNLPLFWDATGKVVRRGQDGKQFLYYELTVANPVAKEMGIPVSAMVSNDQSLPTVLDWLECFRQAEKKHFGFCNLTCPMSITSDQSWVFIIASLKVFNDETVTQYLCRMWQHCKETSARKVQRKTTVHLCCSHIMNNLKKFSLKHCRKIVTFALRCLALLINITAIEQAYQLLYDILVSLTVPKLNSTSLVCINRLISKMNDFSVINVLMPAEYLETDINHELKPGRYTEEDFLNLADASPFRTWGNETMAAVRLEMNSVYDLNESVNNIYFSEVLANHLLTRLIPILPLWSALHNENLSSCPAFSQSCQHASARTNGTIENRFRLLKHVHLGGKKSLRLDDFSVELQSHTIGIQRLSTVSYLKNKNCSKKRKKCEMTISEQWNKKDVSPFNSKTRFGKFQRQPDKSLPELKLTGISGDISKPISVQCRADKKSVNNEIPVINEIRQTLYTTNDRHLGDQHLDHTYATETKIDTVVATSTVGVKVHNLTDAAITPYSLMCPMANINNSCWFNAVMQSLSNTLLGKSIAAYFKKLPLSLSPDIKHTMIAKVCEVLLFMSTASNYGKPVPYRLLQETLKVICDTKKQKHLLLNKQNDVGDFINGLISNIAEDLKQNISIDKEFRCLKCGLTRNVTDSSNITLSICLDESKQHYTLQELLNDNFKERESSVLCSCSQTCIELNRITGLPLTLFIILKRYKLTANKTEKLFTKVVLDKELDFSHVSTNLINMQYGLKAVIRHVGSKAVAGHYTAYTLDAKDHKLTLCDDLHFSTARLDDLNQEWYVAIYDMRDLSIPRCIPSLIECLSTTSGIEFALHYFSGTEDIALSHKKLLEDIKTSNCESVVMEFKSFHCLQICLDELYRHKSDSIENTLEDFHNFLYKGWNERLGIESFCVSCYIVEKCCRCSASPVLIRKDILVIEVDSERTKFWNSEDVMMCSEASTVFPCCLNRSITKEVFVMSLPQTLTVRIASVYIKNLTVTQILSFTVINSCDIFRNMICPRTSETYHLVSVLLGFEESDVYLYNCNGHLVERNGIHFTESINHCKYVILFLNRSSSCRLSIDITEQLSCISDKKLRLDSVTTSNTSNGNQFTCNSSILTLNDVKRIVEEKSWLNSKEINYYMQLLALCSPKNVHVVDCDWFHASVQNENRCLSQFVRGTVSQSESSVMWFKKQLIIWPINIEGIHWILVVIDIDRSALHWIDSLKRSINQRILFQLLTYLAYEYLRCFAVPLDFNAFSIMDYCSFTGFPKQLDDASCGVHICIVAKAFLAENIINVKGDFERCMRVTMFNDIVSHNRNNSKATLTVPDDTAYELPDISFEIVRIPEETVRIACSICGTNIRITVSKKKSLDGSYICRMCLDHKQIKDQHANIEAEGIEMLAKHIHDPREFEVFSLYRFINEYILDNALPNDPSKVLAVSLAPESKMPDFGHTYYTDYHPRRFICVVISGILCWNYQSLYRTLAHELSHVITNNREKSRCRHGKHFHKHGTSLIKKLNAMSSKLPQPFTNIILDVKYTLKTKKPVD